jgi:hypothetical protein
MVSVTAPSSEMRNVNLFERAFPSPTYSGPVAPYLWLVLLVVTVNLLPAFAPPTWSVLV